MSIYAHLSMSRESSCICNLHISLGEETPTDNKNLKETYDCFIENNELSRASIEIA